MGPKKTKKKQQVLNNDRQMEEARRRASSDSQTSEKSGAKPVHDPLAPSKFFVLCVTLSVVGVVFGMIILILYFTVVHPGSSRGDDHAATPSPWNNFDDPFNGSLGPETPVEPCVNCGTPHPIHYFPRIVEREVTFATARKLCSPFQNYYYDLNGLDQANLMFLRATEKIIAGMNGTGVWIGGFFDLKSSNPYLVRWLDGRVTDSLKSPTEIWCEGKHPKDVISKIRQSNVYADRSIVPIVRLKSQSKCLIPYDGDPSKAVFYPLCVTRPAQIFLRLGSHVIIPQFYDPLFLKEALGFVGLNQRKAKLASINGLTNLTILTKDDLERPLLTADAFPYVLVGFKEHVTYSYAQELCRYVTYTAKSPKGTLMTDDTLNSVNNIKLNFYYSIEISTQMANLGSSYPKNSSLTTAGRYDLQKDYYQLMFNAYNRTWPGMIYQRAFPWCESNPKTRLDQIVGEFRKWYSSGGHETTGPYNVYLAIEARNTPLSCLRIVEDDIYWPGSHLWSPLCQFEK